MRTYARGRPLAGMSLRLGGSATPGKADNRGSPCAAAVGRTSFSCGKDREEHRRPPDGGPSRQVQSGVGGSGTIEPPAGGTGKFLHIWREIAGQHSLKYGKIIVDVDSVIRKPLEEVT